MLYCKSLVLLLRYDIGLDRFKGGLRFRGRVASVTVDVTKEIKYISS